MRTLKSNPFKSKGFTLVELMVVVSIISILAAVAIPNYLENIQRGKRSEAKAVLGQMQNWMERYYTENGRYNQNQLGQPLDVANLAFPSSPGGAAPARYLITIENLAANAYTLVATPVAEMAGDQCGAYTLTSQGARAVRGATVALADQLRLCWGR